MFYFQICIKSQMFTKVMEVQTMDVILLKKETGVENKVEVENQLERQIKHLLARSWWRAFLKRIQLILSRTRDHS
jgi:hypothetical protein